MSLFSSSEPEDEEIKLNQSAINDAKTRKASEMTVRERMALEIIKSNFVQDYGMEMKYVVQEVDELITALN